MTISLVKEANILGPNQIYYPIQIAELRNVFNEPIPAISAVATRHTFETKFDDMVGRCFEELKAEASENERLILYYAQGYYREATAIAKSKNLWKLDARSSDIARKMDILGPVCYHQKLNRIRHYGMASVWWEKGLPVLQFIREVRSSFGILGYSGNLTEEFSKEIFEIAFSNEASDVNWISLIGWAFVKRLRVVRVTGAYDDLDVSLDIFGK